MVHVHLVYQDCKLTVE